jgi:protoporphyrinogen/coproporphyrinogen III oxidase
VPDRVDVLIAGGGIAGLAAAHRLAQDDPTTRLALVDRRSLLGGKIQTEHIRGFVIEGGPDSFLAVKPSAVSLCRELGIEPDLVGQIPEHRARVVSDGQLHVMPEGLSGLVPAQTKGVMESPLFTDEGKERFAAEIDIPALENDADESLESFVRRRFGEEVYAKLIEPLMSGIYAGNGSELSLAATFPQLKALEREYGSVLRGLRAPKPTRAAAPRGGFLTPRGGMAEIVHALIPRLGGTCMVDAWVQGIVRTARGYRVSLSTGRKLSVSRVILATPAHVTAQIVSDLDPDLAAILAGIPAVSVATVSLAYEARAVDTPLDGTGYIVPRREGLPVLACSWVSSKFPNRAPEGHVLLRVFMGRRGQDEIARQPEEDLVTLAREEVRARLGIAANPEFVRVFRWPDGMPQYALGHLARLDAIDARLQSLPGLRLAGASYRGVGVPDCITSGERAAQWNPAVV